MGFYADRVLPRLINVVMDTKQTREIRRRVCAGLAGDVVEIGFGTGHNLPFLPAQVRSLRAVEPAGLGVQLAAGRIAGYVLFWSSSIQRVVMKRIQSRSAGFS